MKNWITSHRSARRCRLLCVALAGAALGGCTTLGPDYQRPDVPLPAAWRTAAGAGAELANTEWWRGFGDEDLERLIDAAIDANKDLMLAAYRIDEYNARLQVSRAPNYPQLGYSTAVGRELRSQERPNGLQPGRSPYVSNYEINAPFSWEIDLWGRVKRSNEAALADLLSTEEARRGVMLTVVANVATAYLQLVELDTRLAYALQTLKNRKDLVSLLDAKFQGGSTSRMSVEQARADYEADAAEIPPIERDIATIESTLTGLMGRNPGPVPRRRLATLVLPQMPAGVPADVLAQRPDVMSAEQGLIAANARIGVAKTEYFPTLSLTAAIGLGADDPQWLWARTARTGSIAAAIAGPIFSGGAIEGDIRQAEAQQKQALVTFQKAVQTALAEVEDALVTRTKAGDREAALDRQVVVLHDVLKLSQLRYEGGQSTYVEVLDAERKLTVAQAQQAQARRDTLVALVSVYKAMGGGWMVEQEKRRAPAPELQTRAEAPPEALK